jgi:hypothetical protein
MFITLILFFQYGKAIDLNNSGSTKLRELGILADSLPSDFPKITINTLVNPAPGYIFMESIGSDTTHFYLMVLDNTGKPFWYSEPGVKGIDFKIQPNGLFSYCSPIITGDNVQGNLLLLQNVPVIENILDTSFKKIDSVQMKNGYLADFHDFIILPNGNYLLLGTENNPVDMSNIIKDGIPNADIIGNVIQELDANKNCVFQWRSLDYIPITDTHNNMLQVKIDYVHTSSFYLDYDGNLLVSLIATGEIIKIDMITGKILWHLGGDKNQFDIKGEHPENKPYYFSYQHDIKRLPNGHLLFYDNGTTIKNPPYSRAVEYSLDEKNMTDSLVWEYRHTPDVSGFIMGSAQRLSNGNTLIDWGFIPQPGYYRTITEVTPDKKNTFELSMPADAFSYRALKYELPACLPVDIVTLNDCLQGNTYQFNDKKGQTGVWIYFKIVTVNFWPYNYITIKKYLCPPLNPVFSGEAPVILPCRFVTSQQLVTSFSGEIRFDVGTLPLMNSPDSMKVFFRPTEGSGTFTELTTHYDINENQIIANTSDWGEYVIGYLRSATEIMPPSLLYPFDKQDLINNKPVTLNWSPLGRYDSFRLQVSDDSLFTQTITDLSNIKTPIITDSLAQNKTYYWRAKTFYRDLSSDWSKVRMFKFSEPFITLDTPNGGEKWLRDSNYIIRWETNLPDTFNIALFRNGVQQSVIKNDRLFNYTNAFAWKVPKNTPIDSTYTVKITSINNINSDESDKQFTITAPDGINNLDVNNRIDISNYPNPFGNNTTFEFTIVEGGRTSISIYSLEGKQLKVIFDEFLAPGIYKFNWESGDILSGLYFYKIINGSKFKIDKMIIIK